MEKNYKSPDSRRRLAGRAQLLALVAVLTLALSGVGMTVCTDDSAATTTYSLFYHANEGTWADGTIAGITTVESYAVGTVVTPASPQNITRSGYTFGGWVLIHDANGDGALNVKDVLLCRNNNTQLPTESFTVTGPLNPDGTGTIPLYARWIPTDSAITITFDANGGSGSMSPLIWPASTDCTLPACTFTYGVRTFTHWQTATTGDVITVVNSATSLTVYAGWSIPTYTIEFSANGGSGAIAAQTVESGSSLSLPTAGITRTGYSLAGWSLSAAGTSVLTSPYSPTESVILYAVWQQIQLSITFEPANGTAATVVSVAYGNNVTPPADPTYSGHVFTGWFTDSGCTTAWDPSAVVTASATLYAGWQTELVFTSTPTATSTVTRSTTMDCTVICSAAGSVGTVTWDWGDGTTTAGALYTMHTYASPGTYTVTLTAASTDGSGLTDTVSRDVTVYAISSTPAHADPWYQVLLDYWYVVVVILIIIGLAALRFLI